MYNNDLSKWTEKRFFVARSLGNNKLCHCNFIFNLSVEDECIRIND